MSKPNDSARRLMDAATSAFADGRLEDALRHAGQILVSSPHHEEATLLAGVAEARLGRLDEARTSLMMVLRQNPSSYIAAYWLSVANRRAGRPEEALAAAQQACALKPAEHEALHQLGLCHMDLQNWEAAETHLKQAAVRAPKVASTQFNLGYVSEELGRLTEAKRAYHRALVLNPEHALALNQLGQIMANELDYTGAQKCATRILDLDSQSFAGHSLMCAALIGLNEPVGALVHCSLLQEREPNSPDVWSLYGSILQALGRLDDAQAAFRKAVECDPLQGYAYYGIVKAHKTTEADWPLIAQMEGVLLNPDLPRRRRPNVEFALGKALGDLGEGQASMAHYNAANALTRELKFGGSAFDRKGYGEIADLAISNYDGERFLPAKRSSASDVEPIIVVGMMRSGTTLAEQILSCHPDVGAAGELRFWADQAGHFRKHGAATSTKQAKEMAEAYVEVLRLRAPGKRMVIDKMPGNFLYLGPIHAAFSDAPIIHMRRHPVDTCLSIWMTPNASPVEWGNDKRDIVFAYREYLRLMSHWREVLPSERFLEVDYEELVAGAESVTRRMVAFCGLPWDDRCLRPHDNQRAVATPSDWQVRQPIYGSAVGRWRQYEPWLGDFRDLLDT